MTNYKPITANFGEFGGPKVSDIFSIVSYSIPTKFLMSTLKNVCYYIDLGSFPALSYFFIIDFTLSKYFVVVFTYFSLQ